MRQKSHRNRGEKHQSHGEQRDGTQISPEVAPRHKNRRGIEKRRQKEEEYQFRIQSDSGQTRNDGEQQAAQHQQHGVGDGNLAREKRQSRHRQQQTQNYLDQIQHFSGTVGSLMGFAKAQPQPVAMKFYVPNASKPLRLSPLRPAGFRDRLSSNSNDESKFVNYEDRRNVQTLNGCVDKVFLFILLCGKFERARRRFWICRDQLRTVDC